MTHFGKLTPGPVRFWSTVDKDGPIHPVHGKCWLWLGNPDVYGYGYLTINYQRYLAHRYSYELNVGPVPAGGCVLHRCDNRMCVNPEHLFIGSRSANAEDKVLKDRQAKGEETGHAKLTGGQVNEIRLRYRRWSAVKSNAKELAREFGVKPRAITSVVRRKTWKHII